MEIKINKDELIEYLGTLSKHYNVVDDGYDIYIYYKNHVVIDLSYYVFSTRSTDSNYPFSKNIKHYLSIDGDKDVGNYKLTGLTDDAPLAVPVVKFLGNYYVYVYSNDTFYKLNTKRGHPTFSNHQLKKDLLPERIRLHQANLVYNPRFKPETKQAKKLKRVVREKYKLFFSEVGHPEGGTVKVDWYYLQQLKGTKIDLDKFEYNKRKTSNNKVELYLLNETTNNLLTSYHKLNKAYFKDNKSTLKVPSSVLDSYGDTNDADNELLLAYLLLSEHYPAKTHEEDYIHEDVYRKYKELIENENFPINLEASIYDQDGEIDYKVDLRIPYSTNKSLNKRTAIEALKIKLGSLGKSTDDNFEVVITSTDKELFDELVGHVTLVDDKVVFDEYTR